MTAEIFYEDPHDAGFLVDDIIELSREQVILQKGHEVSAGTVLARLTASGKYVPLKPWKAPPKPGEAYQGDGSDVAVAIAYNYCKADRNSDNNQLTVLARIAAVRADGLIWPDTISAERQSQTIQQLQHSNIILL